MTARSPGIRGLHFQLPAKLSPQIFITSQFFTLGAHVHSDGCTRTDVRSQEWKTQLVNSSHHLLCMAAGTP